MKIIGYYQDTRDGIEGAESVFVAIERVSNGRVSIYAPIGQHSEADEGYIKECREITKGQYKEISKLFYTPVDYL